MEPKANGKESPGFSRGENVKTDEQRGVNVQELVNADESSK